MSSLATHRLIDAAARLDPADRALLNLWVNRGLGDERLTALTGMSAETLRARRQNIIDRLAADLGLPEQDVRDALEQIAPDQEALPGTVNGNAPAASNGLAPTEPEAPSEPEGASEPEAPSEPEGAPEPEALSDEAPPGRRRGVWLGLLAALVAIVVVVVVIAAGSGSTPKPAASSSSTTTTASTATPAAPAPTRPTSGPVPALLAGLPGGLTHASGSVKLSGLVKNLKLNLRVKGLPAAHNGHYEVWLYNSVVDSRPLGRLRLGHDRLTVTLPRNARHYRWIDVSFQPVGAVYHSGESELRASNPAHTTKARLRKHASRTRHRLRQASTVGTAHATGGKSAGAKHNKRAVRHPRPRHRSAHRRRTTKGSRKATTSK
jgi:hypothetical protein